MTLLDRERAYCERCGRRGGRTPGLVEPRAGELRLDWCTECGVLACDQCRPGGTVCEVCDRTSARRGSSPRGRTATLAAAVAIMAVAAAIGAGAWTTGQDEPRGSVLGQLATPAPSGPADMSSSAPATSQDRAGLVVAGTAIPVWEDVLGAWHGQLLVSVRNDGSERLAIAVDDSRFRVTGGGGEIASGEFEAAVPPVVEPGDIAYLVAAFSLPMAPPEDLDATTEMTAAPPPPALLTLEVSDVEVAYGPSGPQVKGAVSNPADEPSVEGAIGVVLVDAGGRPLAGVVDPASAAVLEPGERVEFRAAHPPAPPVDPSSVARAVAAGWARSAATAAP